MLRDERVEVADRIEVRVRVLVLVVVEVDEILGSRGRHWLGCFARHLLLLDSCATASRALAVRDCWPSLKLLDLYVC